MSQPLTSSAIKRRAAELGFDLCGVAPAQPFPELQALPGWLARGFAGRMTYLNRTARKRSDVHQWLPSARSVICVACLYHTNHPLSIEQTDSSRGIVARYAWGDDYHDVLTARLDALLAWMRETHPDAFDAKVGVDDAPVQERVFAMYAGLGWIGKNTCLINPAIGSYVVLGEIVTSLGLESDAPALDQCGTCTLCLDACPTGAIVEPHVVDGRRCLSYLTIEIRKGIPEADRGGVGAHLFGCDICQDVCPHNAAAPVSADGCWQPRAGLDRPVLAALWRATDAELNVRIAGTALRRRGAAGLRRNTAVALGNSGLPASAVELARTPADAPSAADPVVQEHRAWALRSLGR